MTARSGGFQGAVLLALITAGILLHGCSSSSAAPQSGLPVVPGCFVTESGVVPVKLEIASTSEQRQTGLMGREALAPDTGMLFKYENPRTARHGFWMYNTLIPLDIAYLNSHGVIGSIRKMEPCTSASRAGCPTYPAGVPFLEAVEMNAGFFQKHGIGAGDRLFVGKGNCPAD